MSYKTNKAVLLGEALHCDMCGNKDVETVFLVEVLSLGRKWVCPRCYLKLTDYESQRVEAQTREWLRLNKPQELD